MSTAASQSRRPALEEVAPGIHRLSVPVPFRSLRQVNLWFLEDGDGFTMIDCGWGDDQTRDLLRTVWDTSLGGRAVTRLIVTHFHPDHAGNCEFICARWNLTPEMTQLEWMAANLALRSLYTDDFELRARFYVCNGLSREMLERYRNETVQYHTGVRLPQSYRRLRPGMTLEIGGRSWSVMTGQGHSPELAMLYCEAEDILIAGDQVLPKITSNVSVWPWEPLADPLGDYLNSLHCLDAALTSETFVLPSHREPFRDARARITELKQHHAERLDKVVDLLSGRGPRPAADLLEELFNRTLDGHQINFAMGEALAHLNRLVFDGRATRQTDEAGFILFSSP